MMPRLGVLAVVLLVAACSATPSSPDPTVPSSPPPTPTPIALADASPKPCGLAQVALTSGRSGAAAGTMYLNVTAWLVGNTPCLVRAWPSVEVVDPNATVIARGGGAGDSGAARQTALLVSSLEYHLGWASWCNADPPRPLTAWIALVDDDPTVRLPIPQSFGPSMCQGVDTIVFVEPGF